MLFSSMIFLWLFLPFVLVVNFLLPGRLSNVFLLAMSLIFYAWGEPKYIFLMLFSIFINYLGGILLDRAGSVNGKRLVLVGCIVANIGLLGYYKYFNFFIGLAERLAGRDLFASLDIVLPIGISFYTFQILSYVIDLYRGEIRVQKNIFSLALYVSFFPQLIAGPIVRYRDINNEIRNRKVTGVQCAYGIKRFIYGLGKKVILSNTFAATVDSVLGNDIGQISGGLAWLVAILYSLQIYFDFSGYSDMAIGLGRMFGFTFLENFQYPYTSGSVKEFWRRWHISLSSWFKEYVYIPLGGSRNGTGRTYVNLLIIFFLTGFWHGAGLSFIAWGLYYGFFLVIERMFLGKWLDENRFKVLNYVYMFFVVVIGWVFFRLESITKALGFLKRMVTLPEGILSMPMYLDHKTVVFLVIAVLLCGPVQRLCPRLYNQLYDADQVLISESLVLAFILGYSIILLVGNAYNPFIYFRF